MICNLFLQVIMRNPKALHMQYVLGGGGKAKPLDKVAKEFSSCAKLHPVLYSLPKVHLTDFVTYRYTCV